MKRGISSIQMGKVLGIKQHSAWFMMQRLREALKKENNIVLSGIVEADETSVMPKVHRNTRLIAAKILHEREQDRINGKSTKKRLKSGDKKKRGRKKGTTKEVVERMKKERGGIPYNSKKPSERVPFDRGAVIFGIAEQRGRVVMKLIGQDRRSINHRTIIPLLKKHVTPDSTIFTDEHQAYSEAKNIFKSHQIINHRMAFVKDGVSTVNIDNCWKHFKKMIDGTYFHLSYHHFAKYLNENTYRWNRRDESVLVQFEDFLPLTLDKRIMYKDLKKSNENKLAA